MGLSFSESNAQNLIPNGNFEEHSKYKIDERIKDPYYPWTIHLLKVIGKITHGKLLVIDSIGNNKVEKITIQ